MRMLSESELAECASRYCETNVDPQLQVNGLAVDDEGTAPPSVVLPMEPTAEMVDAATQEAWKEDRTRISHQVMRKAIKAMLKRVASGVQV